MTKEKTDLFTSILDPRNIYAAIYSLESYVFDKGLLQNGNSVTLTNEKGKVVAQPEDDLQLYVRLLDKFDMELIKCVIRLCTSRLKQVLGSEDELFEARVHFKLKKWDEESKQLKFRPLHTAPLIDLICMVSILNCLMFEDDYEQGKRSLSDLSKLIPHNFYGNVPSVDVRHLFHPWQYKYKEYSERVIERCSQYRQTHAYQAEVSLDIKNFFPSIHPAYLFDFIIRKLRHQYMEEEQLQQLRMAVSKLLFFKLDASLLKPWIKDYYAREVKPKQGTYFTCGIPQGLPQSYFFGNLCMIAVRKKLLHEDFFQGDAYFYVDDSVIYLQQELSEDKFRKRIQNLNLSLQSLFQENDALWNRMEGLLPKACIDFHSQLAYGIRFHENEKSTYIPIDEISTLTELLVGVNRQTYAMNDLFWNRDELDDKASLDKLEALLKVIDDEIATLKLRKKKEPSEDYNVASRLKQMLRFRKFFLYRMRRLKLKEKGGVDKTYKEAFRSDFLTDDVPAEHWFEKSDEGIFQSEYQLIIQGLSNAEAAAFYPKIRNWENSFIQKHHTQLADGFGASLYFAQDARNAFRLKSLAVDRYGSLQSWTRMNYSCLQNAHARQLQVFRAFLDNEMESMRTNGFQGCAFTRFVLQASDEYKRRMLNVFFSELLGLQVSDSFSFIKANGQKTNYLELRILAFLRNAHFNYGSFVDFVHDLKETELSNAMGVDMGLLEVLGLFITRVRRPEWVDDLICTHRITKGLWHNGSKFLNAYTLHNEEHAVTLVNRAVDLVHRVDYFSLRQVDFYILFLACYLHDLSMVIHPDLGRLSAEWGANEALISSLMIEMNEKVGHFFQVNKEDANNARMKNAGKFLVKVFQQVYGYFEDQVRSGHATDSARFVLNHRQSLFSYLQPTVLSYVATVSESHGYEVMEVYGLRSRCRNEAVRFKYLMMLIRLADLLDVANDRVNYYLLRQNMQHLSTVSKFHWISHLVTDKLELKAAYIPLDKETRSPSDK